MKSFVTKTLHRAAGFSVLALLALGAVTLRYALYAPEELRQILSVLGG